MRKLEAISLMTRAMIRTKGLQLPRPEILRIGHLVLPTKTTTTRLQVSLHLLHTRRAAPSFRAGHFSSSNTPSKTRLLDASAQTASTMGSDQEYIDFLDKANQGVAEGGGGGGGGGGGPAAKNTATYAKGFKTTDGGGAVPEPLAKLAAADGQVFYVSDADEPFEPVALVWNDGGGLLPDEEQFARLIEHPDPTSAVVEIMDPLEWDAQGQYAQVVDAVRRAGRGSDVRVYRVVKGGTRAEYWVVTREEEEGKGGKGKVRVVGMRALAVES